MESIRTRNNTGQSETTTSFVLTAQSRRSYGSRLITAPSPKRTCPFDTSGGKENFAVGAKIFRHSGKAVIGSHNKIGLTAGNPIWGIFDQSAYNMSFLVANIWPLDSPQSKQNLVRLCQVPCLVSFGISTTLWPQDGFSPI